MLRLPPRFAAVILTFAPLFLQRGWRHAGVLLIGAILAPGRRTVASVPRITGLARERHFVNCRRVLNRAAWCPRAAAPAARLMGRRLRAGRSGRAGDRRHHRAPARQAHRGPAGSAFADPALAGRIAARRHPPRPGAVQPRALRQGGRPALASPDAARPRPLGRTHLGAAAPRGAGSLGAPLPAARAAAQDADGKTLTDWARQLVFQARRWLPGRKPVVVGDSGFAALEPLAALSRHDVACVTRLRLDAALHDPAPPPSGATVGCPSSRSGGRWSATPRGPPGPVRPASVASHRSNL